MNPDSHSQEPDIGEPLDASAFIRPPRRVTAYIGMGANLGDARATLDAATTDIAALPGIHATQRSALYRSAPVNAKGPDFVNAVLRVETTLEAEDLLRALHSVENRHGRERPYQNAPRTLDLDLLLYGDARIDAPPRLVVPHPRMAGRAFVLRPLLEVAPDATIPGIGPAAGQVDALAGQRADPV